MNEHESALILQSLDTDLTSDEQARLEALLSGSPAARALRSEHLAVRDAVRTAAGSMAFSPDFTDAVMHRLEAAPAPRLGLVRPLRTRYWMAAAASVFLLVATAVAWWAAPRTLAAGAGEQRTLALSDGSTVHLNSASTITYRPFALRGERRVELEGEAFFVVATSSRPFVVATFNAEVRVLGTRFNVTTRPLRAAAETRVAVEEGRVLVHAAASSEGVTLAANEQTAVASDAAQPLAAGPAALDETLAWRTGGLAFQSIPLPLAVDELVRRYNRPIVLDESVGALSIAYLTQTRLPLEAVLSDICTTLHLNFRRTADGYEIYRP